MTGFKATVTGARGGEPAKDVEDSKQEINTF